MEITNRNDIIHQLTKEKTSSLYIEITSLNKTNMFIRYDFFFVNNENNGYRLNVGGKATGSLEDKIRNAPLSDVINNARFTTFDKDNDRSPGNCATEHRGGWWFNYCHDVFLNGLYPPGQWHQPWDPPFSNGSYVSSTKMMTRRKKFL
ncbi:ryncolin-1-like [Saccostrea cucullata]|uniref:ryncolin-1-like n=1 Tax=Saccostrea cuccullata TaxID=36930 RepID=UPI002ED1C0ED